MKYAIMSDVHANPAALAAALADARALGCKKYVMLGDITGYGYDAKGALDMVRESFDIVLMGNHDSACLGMENSPMDKVSSGYDLDRKQRKSLARDDAKWLRERPLSCIADGMAFVHGDFTRPRAWNYITKPAEAVVNFESRKESILFCGHTHHAEVWRVTPDLELSRPSDKLIGPAPSAPESILFARGKGDRHLVNVGSIGYPREDHCSTYAICDPTTDAFEIRRLPFDFKSYVMMMLDRDINLPGWLADLLPSVCGTPPRQIRAGI